MLAYIKEREPLHADRWVPASELKDHLALDFVAAPRSAAEQQKKSWLFATFARMLEDASRVEYKVEDDRVYYRSTPVPDWILSSRSYYLGKALGASMLDRTFYASYFNEYKMGNYFDCPIDARSLSPEASEELIASAIQRSRRLYLGQNSDEPLNHEQAVEKLKRENPGFCEDVYTTIVNDNIQGMR